ncbi:hypothetical protein [Umezawaea beigongshangensis]|nr:hypothetical protein [Umezawaea beigongshangensis]
MGLSTPGDDVVPHGVLALVESTAPGPPDPGPQSRRGRPCWKYEI